MELDVCGGWVCNLTCPFVFLCQLIMVSLLLQLAQQLYEGVKLSDGEATGLITYMRTDGFHVLTFFF
jgi:hypothetical protein